MVLLSLLVVHPPLPSPHSKCTTLFQRLISYLYNRALMGSGDAQSPNSQTSHRDRGANFLILHDISLLNSTDGDKHMRLLKKQSRKK
jgi:hypothetical protein